MAEQVVITKFVGDTSDIDAKLAKAEGGIDALNKSAEDAAKAMGDLSGAMGQVAGRVTTAAEAGKAMGKAMQQAGDAGASGAAKAQGMWASVFGKIKGGATDAAGKVKSAWSGGLQGVKDALKDAAETAASTFGTVGTKVVGALGPIGVAIAVIVGLFAKLFASTDAGTTKLDGLRRSFGMVFDKIVGAFKNVADAFTSGDTAVGKFFGTISDGVAFVTAPLTGLVSLIGRITGLSDAFADANAAGQKLAQMYDDIDDAQIGNIQKNAELERQINRLNIQLRDRTKTDAERIAIADELFRLEKQRSEEELAILKQTTAAKQFQADQELQNTGEVNDALRRELAEAKAAETRALTDSETLQENAQRRVNQIKEQAANEAKAIAEKAAQQEQQRREKAKAAAEKAAQEEKARLEKLAQARANATELAAQAELELRKAEAAPHEAQKLDLAARYEAEIKKVKQAFDELVALSGDNAKDIEAIRQQEADAVTAIRQREVHEATALEAQRVAEIDKINQGVADRAMESAKANYSVMVEAQKKQLELAVQNGDNITDLLARQEQERGEVLASIRDQEVADMLQRFDDEYAAAEAAGADLAALTEQQQRELNDLNAKYRQEDEAARIESAKRATELVEAQNQVALTAAQGLGEAMGQMFTGRLEDQKAFEKALLKIVLDAAKAQIRIAIVAATAKEVGSKGVLGLATAALLTGLLEGLFAGLNTVVQGLATGGEVEGGGIVKPGWGKPIRRSNGDNVLVTLRTGEMVLNEKQRKKAEGMYGNGVWGAIGVPGFMPNYAEALALNSAPRVNAYMASSEGHSAAMALLPGGFDKRIVKAQKESNAIQRENTRLLRAALRGGDAGPSISKRYR